MNRQTTSIAIVPVPHEPGAYRAEIYPVAAAGSVGLPVWTSFEIFRGPDAQQRARAAAEVEAERLRQPVPRWWP